MISFSIIIPSFNAEETISETLNSVIKQSYIKWECLVLDDCSSDNTCEVVEKYASSNEKIRLFRSDTPSGPSLLRNKGIENSSFNYIIFLDSDDLLHENCLLQRADFIRRNPGFNMWIFYMQMFGEKTGIVNRHTAESSVNDLLLSFTERIYPWAITCVTWEKSFLTKLQGFHPILKRQTDPYIHIKALLDPEVKIKIYPKREADCFYRIWKKQDNVTKKIKEDVIESNIIFNRWLIDSLKSKGKLNEFRHKLRWNLRRALGQMYNQIYPIHAIIELQGIYRTYRLLTLKDRISFFLLNYFHQMKSKWLSKRFFYYYKKFIYKMK